MIPLLAALLSPSNFKLPSFPKQLEKNCRNYLKELFNSAKTKDAPIQQQPIQPTQNNQESHSTDLFTQLRMAMNEPNEPPKKKAKTKSELDLYFEKVETGQKYFYLFIPIPHIILTSRSRNIARQQQFPWLPVSFNILENQR